MDFMDWDRRPAVLGEREAWAKLKRGGPWVKVDYWDVYRTAGLLHEVAWRERFKDFGELDPPCLDDPDSGRIVDEIRS